jgi:hypothetical protein
MMTDDAGVVVQIQYESLVVTLNVERSELPLRSLLFGFIGDRSHGVTVAYTFRFGAARASCGSGLGKCGHPYDRKGGGVLAL